MNSNYPAHRNIFFVITIDTEIDKSPDWSINVNGNFTSVLEGIPKILNPIFIKYGARPTYLISSEVIDNNNCVAILKGISNCKFEGERSKEIQNAYSRQLEYRKLKNLTNLFFSKFGYNPKSFRAGRFAAGNNTIYILQKLGYLTDSSVTPGINWNLKEGRVNYLKAREQPYFANIYDLLEEGKSSVLEVPVSIITSSLKKYIYFEGNSRLSNRANLLIDRFLSTRWLRPSFQSTGEMIHTIEKILRKFPRNNNIILNMMFHSMEVIPSASPYNITESDCKAFLKRLALVLDYCRSNGFKFVTLSELYHSFKGT